MRFTVRIGFSAALATAASRGQATSTAEVTGAVPQSNGAVIPGAAGTMTGGRSNQ